MYNFLLICYLSILYDNTENKATQIVPQLE
jgi:hypothetical protein